MGNWGLVDLWIESLENICSFGNHHASEGPLDLVYIIIIIKNPKNVCQISDKH